MSQLTMIGEEADLSDLMLEDVLYAKIHGATAGRLRFLKVVTVGDQVCVWAAAPSYHVRQLAEQAVQIRRLAAEKHSTIVAHNYLFPEFHELADKVGDSLGLSFYVRDRRAARVDFESVYFMGATAKMITGDATRVFVSDRPAALGCSLVFGTDHEWVERWKARHPHGLLITYVNSDA